MTVNEAITRANTMADTDYHINAGIERRAVAKMKDGKQYIRIDCYTLNGKYKGNYKCGNIDADGNYSVGAYDDVNLDTMQYIGR
jgi:hypothetical protein